jgi:hypothetical protein
MVKPSVGQTRHHFIPSMGLVINVNDVFQLCARGLPFHPSICCKGKKRGTKKEREVSNERERKRGEKGRAEKTGRQTDRQPETDRAIHIEVCEQERVRNGERRKDRSSRCHKK